MKRNGGGLFPSVSVMVVVKVNVVVVDFFIAFESFEVVAADVGLGEVAMADEIAIKVAVVVGDKKNVEQMTLTLLEEH